MNAAGRVPHVVRQVDLGRLPEITLRQRSVAKARRHKRVNCRAQRASMPTARLVILKIGLADLRRHALPEEMYQHHDIRLLDDLGPLNALATEQHVHRCGSRHERGKVDLLQAEIAAELLEQAGPLVEPSIEIAGDMLPPVRLLRLDTEPARKRLPLLGPALRDKIAQSLPRPPGSIAPCHWCTRCHLPSRGIHRAQ